MGETWPTLLIAFIPVGLAALFAYGWNAIEDALKQRRKD